jgi:2-polyprenyl-3-methyl-5-hydroxy-6-metoxy-1,4-benzoquinol methylase
MKAFDLYLQRVRISKVRPYARAGARVLDIGSSDAALYWQIPGLGHYVGVDPDLEGNVELGPGAWLLKGLFPEALVDREPFDVIAMLAVLEHIPDGRLEGLARDCCAYLKEGGHLVITVPVPAEDHVLKMLRAMRIVHAATLHEHHGYDVRRTVPLFEGAGLELVKRRRFQLGLNNLFVFRKRAR